ncbi:MAG: septum site-determining protein MinC [Firmicutes bacterium]|nr:septum site-determining protein MinC [Bacillota bacterium]
MPEEAVLFKGTREGIHIYLNDEVEFPQVVNSLEQRLATSRNFFRGARVVINTGRRTLSADQMATVSSILKKYEGVQLVRLEQIREPEPPNSKEMTSLIVEKPVRSGQQLYHPGHIVIIGDVNPGAEIIAEGNIVVMGALRGTAHAGYGGNRSAFVAANIMMPAQVSIAGVLARRPDGETVEAKLEPEIARLRDGQIIIEPCHRINY